MSDVDPYLDLIDAFLDRRIPADTFQSRYFALFKADTAEFDAPTFDALDALFADLDSWTDDPGLLARKDGFHISGAALRERAAAAAAALRTAR